ncbi:MAG: hypothetical protein K6G88_09540 [Lachnospiraceae bacterium]|nr:hypothetical protein [Lachnospiraceae bacterium]
MSKKIRNYIEQNGKNNLTLALKGLIDGGLSKGLKYYDISEDLNNDRLLLNLVELETRKGEGKYELIKPFLTMMRLYKDKLEIYSTEIELYDEAAVIKYYQSNKQNVYETVTLEQFDDMKDLIKTIKNLVAEKSRPKKELTYYPYSIKDRKNAVLVKNMVVMIFIMLIGSTLTYYFYKPYIVIGIAVSVVLSLLVGGLLVVLPHGRFKRKLAKQSDKFRKKQTK